jgi:hypothetical protein
MECQESNKLHSLNPNEQQSNSKTSKPIACVKSSIKNQSEGNGFDFERHRKNP